MFGPLPDVCAPDWAELPLKTGVYQEGAVQNKGKGRRSPRKIKMLGGGSQGHGSPKKAPAAYWELAFGLPRSHTEG
jgi:hypothetical protein